MKLKFWGVRGSIPSPIQSQPISQKIVAALIEAGRTGVNLQNKEAVEAFVAGLPFTVHSTIGGNTTCLTLESTDQLIIFDAGSGMRELGRYLMTREFAEGKGRAAIFFTHTHWDHIQGFPFFVPAFIPGNEFDVYHVHPYVPDVLNDQMDSRVFPAQFAALGATFRFHKMDVGETVSLGAFSISNIELQHPGKAYAYRVEKGEDVVVLATDGEYKRLDHPSLKRYIDFYRDADMLIFDAQFSVRESFIKEDWGHSSGLIGADIARAAKVKRLVLFHHDPTSTDDEIMAALQQTREYLTHHDRRGPVMVDVAREGWEVVFNSAGDFQVEEANVDGLICLHLFGQFDARATETFMRSIVRVGQAHQNETIVLNMAGLQEISVAGVRALLEARGDVYNLAIVNVPPNVYRVMELSGTVDFFAIYPGLSDVPH